MINNTWYPQQRRSSSPPPPPPAASTQFNKNSNSQYLALLMEDI